MQVINQILEKLIEIANINESIHKLI